MLKLTRTFIILFLTFLLLILLLFYSYFIEPFNVKVTYLNLTDFNLSKKIKVVAVSDLHISPHIWKNINYLIKYVCKEKPQMLWIAGDVIDDKNNLYLLEKFLKNVRNCTHYIIAVSGNWEFESHTINNVIELYKKYNVIFLDNKKIHLFNLTIAGISVKSPNFSIAKNADIVITHYPLFGKLVIFRYHPKFVFCGHTHGGQVVIPLIGPIYLPPYSDDLVSGLYILNGSKIYVTRGLGVYKNFPFRFNCPPEIVVIELE